MDGGIEESDSSVVVFFALSFIKSSLNKWPLLSGSSNYAGGIATVHSIIMSLLALKY